MTIERKAPVGMIRVIELNPCGQVDGDYPQEAVLADQVPDHPELWDLFHSRRQGILGQTLRREFYNDQGQKVLPTTIPIPL